MAEAAAEINGWERALMAAEKVKERLRRATRALDAAGVPYAVAGGNAVAEWVGRVDEDAVRNTRDVDLLIRRDDLPAARAALEAAGLSTIKCSTSIRLSTDRKSNRAAECHLLFAGEKLRPKDECPMPAISESQRAAEFQVASLEALVRMKLTAWRDKDRTHLRDLIGVGLIDATWPARLPSLLGDRLQQLLADPNG